MSVGSAKAARISVISTWATGLCVTVLYHKLGCFVFSDGVQDFEASGMVPLSGVRTVRSQELDDCSCGLGVSDEQLGFMPGVRAALLYYTQHIGSKISWAEGVWNLPM